MHFDRCPGRARRIVAGGNASNIGDKQPDVQPMDSRAS
jgi:hypothetical protein